MKILAGNWKMFKTRAEARHFFEGVGAQIAKSSVRKIVATSPTLLESSVVAAAKTGIEVFSQNCAWAESGAFTGEISPLQLKDIGVTGTLVGHSERRQFFGETDATCQKRAESALKASLHVIYCIGESLDERKAGATRAVLEKQLAPVIAMKAAKTHFVLAYEPVWAIGTGVVAEVPQVKEAHGWISEILGRAQLPSYEILYGGSVKPNNFKELSQVPFVSGGLVGGASLDVQSYLDLHACLV